MKKIETIKAVGGLVVSIGVSVIVNDTIKRSLTLSNMNIIKKVCVGAGAIVLSNMVSEKAVEYVESKVDGVVNEFKKAFVNVD